MYFYSSIIIDCTNLITIKLVGSVAPVEEPEYRVDIAELAEALANGTVTVTVALWARVAFLVRFHPFPFDLFSYESHSVESLVLIPARRFGRVWIPN